MQRKLESVTYILAENLLRYIGSDSLRLRDTRPLRDRSDRKFIEDLYQTHKRLMFFVAKGYASEKEDREDIVQTAVEKLMRQVPKLREMEEQRRAAYVTYTVKSVAVDMYRVRKRRREHVVSLEDQGYDWLEIEDTRVIPMDNYLVSQEMQSRLKEVWPRLPEEDQILLEGRYTWELTDQELADRVRCKPGSIRMKLTRARRRLFQYLTEKEEVT